MTESEPEIVNLTPDEFRLLTQEGYVEVRCQRCDWKVTSATAKRPGGPGGAEEYINHQMEAHGFTRQQAMQENASVVIQINEESAEIELTGKHMAHPWDPKTDEAQRLIRSGKIQLPCPLCDWQAPMELLGRDKANSLISHLQEKHGQNGDEAFATLVKVTSDMTCPRCGLLMNLPPRGSVGEGPGRALSRTPGDPIYICDDCGSHEAYQSMAREIPTPRDRWPIDRPSMNPDFETFSDTWEKYRSSNRAALTPAPTPREVPDLRLHLMEKWLPGGPFDKKLTAEHKYGDIAAWSRNWERQCLKDASLWWVRAEMVDLIMAAAPTIPPDIHGHEVPKPDGQAGGFAVLAKPWVGQDALTPDEQVKVHAIAWGRTSIDGNECLSISTYEYFDFAAGLGPKDLQRSILTGAVFDAVPEMVGNGPPDERSKVLRGGSWIHLGRTDWPLADTIEGFEVEDENGVRYDALIPGQVGTDARQKSMIEDRRFFTAFCVLVNQRISETEMIYSPRSTRRRAEREGGIDPKREPSHVRLIKLREPKRDHEPEIDPETGEVKHVKREYSHRWLVTHTKMAWRRCGPGHQDRRLVWIAPYIKGPADKELIIKDEVRVWTR